HVTGPGESGRFVSAVALKPTGWLLFVEQPSAEALAPVRQALLRGLLLFAIGIVVAFLASLWSASRLSGPIVQLRKSAQRFARGDLAARVEVKTGDDVEAVAEEFNHMAAQLQDYANALERKVEEKTAELAAALK